MATMHCEIVSAEKELFSGEIEMLSARGTIGELGIMPGHAPLLTGIQPGTCLLYTSPSPRDATLSRMPSSA